MTHTSHRASRYLTDHMTGNIELFGIFHIAAALAAAVIAFLAAKYAAGFVMHAGRSRLIRILQVTGWVLVLLEMSKQLYLQFNSGGGGYDWWYFPFQLCSVPMYLCVLLPYVKGRLREAFLTFMSGYTFVSALAALIYPEDILQAAPSLMVHGFLWHGMLLFISLLIFMTGAYDASAKGLLRAGALFLCLCAIAVIINVLAEPVMQAGHTAHSYAAMFYLNPYHISPQPIVSSVQKTAGIPAGLLLYVIAVIAASASTSLLLHPPAGASASGSGGDQH